MAMSYKKACTVLEEFTECEVQTETLIHAITLIAETFHCQNQASAALADLNRNPPQITDAVRECISKLITHVNDSPGMEKRLLLSAQELESRKIALGFGFVSLVLALYALWMIFLQGISHEQLLTILFWSWIPALPWPFIFSRKRKLENALIQFHRFQSIQENRGLSFGEWSKIGGSTSNTSSPYEIVALLTALYLVMVVMILQSDY